MAAGMGTQQYRAPATYGEPGLKLNFENVSVEARRG
jgi:hypothetical protein